MRFSTILLTGALLAAGPASAATYYMAPAGSDSNAGTSAAPWATCVPFQAVAQPGDNLVAKVGTYQPADCSYDDWQASGTAAAPIVFRGEGDADQAGNSAVFDGQFTSGYFLELNDDAYVTVRNLRITRWDDSFGNGAILVYNGAHHITIEDSYFKDNGTQQENDHDVYLNGGGDACNEVIVRRNVFDGGTVTDPGGGVHMFHGPGCTNIDIANNFFKGKYYGVVVGDGVDNLSIHHNTFWNNGFANGDGANISLANHGTVALRGVDIRNNLSAGNNGAYSMKIGSRDAGVVTEAYNLHYNSSRAAPILYGSTSYNVANYQAASGKGVGDIQSAPLFSNPGGSDLLNSTSPAVDAGNGTNVGKDRLNVTRPQGAARDMGSRER